jgi:NADH dehydrogenase FAD-containing subunit
MARMTTMIEKIQRGILILKMVAFFVTFSVGKLRRGIIRHMRKQGRKLRQPQPPKPEDVHNVVVIGASFAGYYTAKQIALSLPSNGRYRVVVIEPNSHFQFTWVFPRFCVIPDNEHKAFIPYGPFLSDVPEGSIAWIRDRVTTLSRDEVELSSGKKIPYDFCVLATGSGAGVRNPTPLPTRVPSADRADGIDDLRAMQLRIKNAKQIVVVGGGAAGYELSTDCKSLYPEKEVTLVHSRAAAMHRFGPALQKIARDSLESLGVKLYLNERAISEQIVDGKITLASGTTVECDLFVCTTLLYH